MCLCSKCKCTSVGNSNRTLELEEAVWRKLNNKERWREGKKGGNGGDEGVKVSLEECKLA